MEIIVKKLRTAQMHSIVYSFILFFAISFCNEMKGMLSQTRIGLSPEAKAIREAARKKYLESRGQRIIKDEKSFLRKEAKINIQRELSLQKIQSQLPKNEFFVYEKDTDKGILVDKEIIELSETFKTGLGDISDDPKGKMIALQYPFKIIESTFLTLNRLYDIHASKQTNLKEDRIIQSFIQNQSFEELIAITELINYLNVSSSDIENLYFSAVKNRLDSGQEKIVLALSTIKNPVLWKQLLINPTILSYIKGLMMQYNMTHIKEDYLGWGSFSSQTIKALAFSPDDKSIAVGRDNGPNTCSLFDIKTKTLKAGINLQRTYPILGITSIAFNNDGSTILAGTSYPGLHLWHLKDLKFEEINYLRIDRSIKKAIFNPKNNKEVLICISYYLGENLQLLDVTQDSFQLHHNFANKQTIDIAFSPDGTQFVSASWQDNIISLWDKEKKSLINSWKCESNLRSNAIKSIAFNNDGKKIIAAYIKNAEIGQHGRIEYADTNLCIIDIINPNESIKKDFPLLRNKKNAGLSFFLTKDDKIIAWDSLGSMFLITLDDNGITNEIQIRQAPSTWSLNSSSIFSLALSSDEKKLAGGGKDTFARENYVHLWTTLTDSDTTILKNLQTLQDSHFISNQDRYKLIYQFWLNSRKGIAPSRYTMDAKEQSIYNSLPKEIKRLFLNN